MVLTQLQLKWPNHSKHLLTRLTYLFKNEQLVDCTLTCNKHSLKVHRSVLAACSPYFERELQNNPSIVVKDMQFSVLQALIEFMYYGETRITEENLTSLIEAAKLFEVKGLSEMDLMNGRNGVISPILAVDSDCMVESSCPSDDTENTSFDATSSTTEQQSLTPSTELTTLTALTTYDGDTGGDLMVESADAYEPHSSRNFVVTPPQTESAQILLSLARSHNQNQPSTTTTELADTCNVATNTDGFLSTNGKEIEHSITNNMIFTGHNVIINELAVVNGGRIGNDMIGEESRDKCSTNDQTDSGKSLLAKLLTRNNQVDAKARYEGDNYKTLYETTTGAPGKAEDEIQPSIILECPFLIETNDGSYVDVSVENMLSAFENGDIFEANGKNVKIVPKEEERSVDDNALEDALLEHISHETAANELVDDPEAVVLCKVGADGRLEKYVLSSADVRALQQMNERMAAEKRSAEVNETHIAEIEIPVSNSDTPLITRILDCGSKVENAISRLPFKKAGYLSVSGNVSESGASGLASSERILDATLTVDAHHHENMFEELDNQFSMDCSSIDNIQRDYVAYEEASKNETQLEHNYYANAMKDEDEECVVISDNYDLRMLMLTEEAELATLTAKTAKRSRVLGDEDVCLNGYASPNGPKNPTRVNGLGGVDKTAVTLNGAKCDLILNKDDLITPVVASPGVKTNQKRVNGLTKNLRASKPEANAALPFKSVKSANTYKNSQLDKKPAKRTYKRKPANSSPGPERKRNGNLNAGFCNENSLVEEIIVDEVS